MKKLFLAIVMCGLWSVNLAAENVIAQPEGKKNPTIQLPSRLIQGIEIDPLCKVHAGDKFYRISELGVELIWDSQLKVLYVLETNYYQGMEIALNDKFENKFMPITNVLDIFMMKDVGRSSLCLGKIVESGEQYWLNVVVDDKAMEISICENMSDDVIFTDYIKNE